jgi:hypothetical protein
MTVGKMKKHLTNCGYPFWPTWCDEPNGDGMHLTKGGAQAWLRHLFSLEKDEAPAPPVHSLAVRAQGEFDGGWRMALGMAIDATQSLVNSFYYKQTGREVNDRVQQLVGLFADMKANPPHDDAPPVAPAQPDWLLKSTQALAKTIARRNYPANVIELLDTLEAQAKQIEALQADAGRYRWLRGKAGPELLYGREQYTRVCSVCQNDTEDLDAAIDAALANAKATQPLTLAEPAYLTISMQLGEVSDKVRFSKQLLEMCVAPQSLVLEESLRMFNNLRNENEIKKATNANN